VQRNRYLIEALLFASYVFFAMSWTAGAAFIPQIMKALNIGNLAAASNITNAVSAAKILGTFVAAAILSRLFVKRAVTLAMALMAIGILTPFVTNYPLLLAVRFLMGLGGALIVVYFAPVIMQLFSDNERPFVNGLNSVAFNVTLVFISLGSVVCLLLWLLLGETPRRDASAATGATSSAAPFTMVDGLKERFTWIYSLTYAGILSFYVVLFTFYKNAGINEAKYVILAGIFGTVVGILVARSTTRRLPVLRISGLLQVLAIIGLHSKVWGLTQSDDFVALCAIVAGFFIFLPMTSLVTLGQEQRGMTSQKASVTFSLFWSISYLVATFVPFIFAHLVDTHGGNYAVAFGFITVISGSFLVGSMLLPESARVQAASERLKSA
jgi:CP family cyanate transporter-like MFS transporter